MRVRGPSPPSDTHGITVIDGVQVEVVSHQRLHWRAQRVDDRWLIAGLRSVYISDLLLVACNPERVSCNPGHISILAR